MYYEYYIILRRLMMMTLRLRFVFNVLRRFFTSTKYQLLKEVSIVLRKG